jgi:glycosyltransferase involved in cell wall biosynthesis
MPIRDGSRYLQKAIRNLSNNALEGDEIVVVNDNSADSTLTILEEWASSDPRVVVIDNKLPGLANALNLGIQHCSNGWIARFDVDDEYSIERLAKQRTLIHTDVAAIFADYIFTQESGRSLGKIPSAVTDFGTRISLLQGRRTAHPSVLFNKQKVLLSGCYNQDEYPAEDLGLWLRLLEHGKFCSVPEVLLHYSLSQNSVTVTKRLESQAKKNQLISSFISRDGKIAVTSAELKDLMAVYRKLPDGFERYVFFSLDLILSRKNLEISFKDVLRLISYFLLGFCNLKGIKLIFTILRDYLARRNLRKGFS